LGDLGFFSPCVKPPYVFAGQFLVIHCKEVYLAVYKFWRIPAYPEVHGNECGISQGFK
jgi:hypothetical protein